MTAAAAWDLYQKWGLEVEQEHGEVMEIRPGSWRLELLPSQKQYRLVVPEWTENLQGREILVSVSHIGRPMKVSACVLQQTRNVLLNQIPGMWEEIWLGRREIPPCRRLPDGRSPTRGILAQMLEGQ